MSIGAWFRARKSLASVIALAVIVAGPVALAITHKGFPLSDVDLNSRDVWVTKSSSLLTGRLNMQIEELNASTEMTSNDFDVLQDGLDVFVHDKASSTVSRVDPAFVQQSGGIELPAGAQVSYAKSTMSILDPVSGQLWVLRTQGELQFNAEKNPAAGEFGDNASAVVSSTGSVFIASPAKNALYRMADASAKPKKFADLAIESDSYQLTAVGDRAAVLDGAERLLLDDGRVVDLPNEALRLQQMSAAHDFVVVATGDGLLKVGFDGEITSLDADVSTPESSAEYVSAPVSLGDCVHGAWSSTQRYFVACSGEDPESVDIVEPTVGSILEFRVNRSVIALNNLSGGDVWLVTEGMQHVDNWNEVTPPAESNGPEGTTTTTQESFEDTLAKRTDRNTAPIARADQFGARPSKTTILPVLDNDTDADGDILTISSVGDVPESVGSVVIIDGGRALQFTPGEDTSSTVSIPYTASDGRPGGVSESRADVSVRAYTENSPPVQIRNTQVSGEATQTVRYNVLGDWRDPDGDDLLLTGAAATTDDLVRYTPGGEITFTNRATQVGLRTVTYSLSDGYSGPDGQSPPGTATGELIIDVKAPGELKPSGVPDFASAFVGDSVDILPLANDLSPAGTPLSLRGVDIKTEGITITTDPSGGRVTARAGQPGSYYLQYTFAAGDVESIGLIRVDVSERSTDLLDPVAVADVAYLRPNEPIVIPVLSNDFSPTGQVLGIQSTALPTDTAQLSVEVLNNSVIRVTAPSALTKTIFFSYTISDGARSATASVTVVPVPELTRHQAPIANPDSVMVRAGDVASVSVLTNDYHPDGARMILDSELVQSTLPDTGLAFITGEQVRVQAPTEAGQYSVTYRITDAFNESSAATVTFIVLDPVIDGNRPPTPRLVTARVFAGGAVTVPVPLDGIDPDGDSVVFVSVSGATKGTVQSTSTDFTYQANADAIGTDEFTYQVRDSAGQSSTGTVRVGVIPRSTVQQPNAVDDAAVVRPERVAAIPVLSNDSDPNGYPLDVTNELLEVQEGITATVNADNQLVVEAGSMEGLFVVRYEIDNGFGGKDNAFVKISVSPDAPLKSPTAIDHVIEPAEVVGKQFVDVDVREGAYNPSGLPTDLVVGLAGPNVQIGVIDPSTGIVRVTLGDTRKAIAYTLTNDTDDLSATAFIVVPPAQTDEPPRLRAGLGEQVVRVDETKTWRLSDILEVPSGRPAIVINAGSARANGGQGALVRDNATIEFTPAEGFRGQTAITFEVTDGSSADDSRGLKAVISLPVTVGDPEQRDVAPTFANAAISIEAGEPATTFDLRAASSHPNPEILAQLSYLDLNGQTADVQATQSGSTLTISAPSEADPGDTATLTFTVNYEGFDVPGQVVVTVVSSTRPLAQTVDDVEPEGRSSQTYVISPLSNDFNPFAATGDPLKIVDATIDGTVLGASRATVSFTASTVTINTSADKSGTVTVIYRVQDRTRQTDREVQGRITVTVASAPEPPTLSAPTNPGSGQVDVVFQAPSSSNGAEITGYTVRVAGNPSTVERTDCSPGATCSIGGRTNGQEQTITVGVTNKVGTTWSTSRAITAYGTPGAPLNPNLTSTSGTAPSTIQPTWQSNGGDTSGGSIRYEWNFTAGTSGSGTTNGTSGNAQVVGQADYAFQVRACNPANRCSDFVSASRNVAPTPPPPPSISFSKGAQRSGSMYFYHVEARNFSPNVSFSTECFSNDGSGEVRIGTTPYRSDNTTRTVFDGAGSFSGDIACWDGFGNVNRVVINGTSSNTSDF